MHIQTKPDGQMKPCCRFDIKHPQYKTENGYKFDRFNVDKLSFTDAVKSEEWQEIRNTILAGDRVPGCRKCYQEEDFQFASQSKNEKRKIKSLRVKENWMWNEDIQDRMHVDDGTKLRYLELAFGNHCNLKCRTCNGSLSTAWYDDDNIMAPHYNDRKFYSTAVNVKNDWNVEDFLYAEEIKFTGGEPMLHPNFIKTIDMIISTGRQHLITLDIFTNASWVPKDKIFNRLEQFKKVNINLSVDGVGPVNDYIRYPSEWSIVSESVNEWLKIEKKYTGKYYEDNGEGPFLKRKYVVKWVPCISIYNVWHFHKMIDWWLDLQTTYKKKDCLESITINHSHLINIIHDPKYLKPSIYPKRLLLTNKLIQHRDARINDIKEQVDDVEKQWSSELHMNDLYNKVLGALNEEPEEDQLKIFVEYTADLDKIRGQDIRKDLPHLWKRIEGTIEYKGIINE
jgi:hypothetical protein